MAGGSTCYLAQIIGSLILFFGSRAGIYISAIAVIVNFCDALDSEAFAEAPPSSKVFHKLGDGNQEDCPLVR